MEERDQRTNVERRVGSALNAKPPYLTKQGPVIFDRRSGRDRRIAVPVDSTKQPDANVVEA